jgi:ectoine hydroxylase-related dioxygenase (phytanoyl-CoA dioxygenase family)
MPSTTVAMSDEQRFLYDLNGYLVIEGALSKKALARMRADVEAKGPREVGNDAFTSRFGGFLEWGPDWRALIDHPRILPLLIELLGPRFRLDHAYGMAMRAGGAQGGEGLHHQGAMYDHGSVYANQGGRMHNGLVVVSFTLVDVPAGAGGFCCIPGTHKANYPLPKQWYGVYDNPHLEHVPMRAGDALIFCEGLTHGTLPWTCETHERRAVLLKYAPGYMQWARDGMALKDPAPFSERQLRILQRAGDLISRPAVMTGRPGYAGG